MSVQPASRILALPQTRQPGGGGPAGLLAHSSATDGELPAGGKEAIFSYYVLTYQVGTDGE